MKGLYGEDVMLPHFIKIEKMTTDPLTGDTVFTKVYEGKCYVSYRNVLRNVEAYYNVYGYSKIYEIYMSASKLGDVSISVKLREDDDWSRINIQSEPQISDLWKYKGEKIGTIIRGSITFTRH